MKRKEGYVREREAAEPGEEQDAADGRPLECARFAVGGLVREATSEIIDGDCGRGRLGGPRCERHGGKGDDPGEHAEVEHVERAVAPEEARHAELEEYRNRAHEGKRAADL